MKGKIDFDILQIKAKKWSEDMMANFYGTSEEGDNDGLLDTTGRVRGSEGNRLVASAGLEADVQAQPPNNRGG